MGLISRSSKRVRVKRPFLGLPPSSECLKSMETGKMDHSLLYSISRPRVPDPARREVTRGDPTPSDLSGATRPTGGGRKSRFVSVCLVSEDLGSTHPTRHTRRRGLSRNVGSTSRPCPFERICICRRCVCIGAHGAGAVANLSSTTCRRGVLSIHRAGPKSQRLIF